MADAGLAALLLGAGCEGVAGGGEPVDADGVPLSWEVVDRLERIRSWFVPWLVEEGQVASDCSADRP